MAECLRQWKPYIADEYRSSRWRQKGAVSTLSLHTPVRSLSLGCVYAVVVLADSVFHASLPGWPGGVRILIYRSRDGPVVFGKVWRGSRRVG